MEFHNQHFSPMDQFIIDPDTNDILGVKANKGNALDFLPLQERDVARPNGRAFYVDFRTAANGGKGSTANSGRSWRAPFLTMAKALSACVDFDTITWIGKCQEYGLSLPSGVEYVTIQGGGAHPMCSALWKPNGGTYGIQVSTKGIRFRNFKGEPQTGQALIKAVQSATQAGSDGVIDSIECNGNGQLIEAIAVDQWSILRCDLHDMEHAIKCDEVGHSAALRWKIIGNLFRNNLIHVRARLTDAIVAYNFFQHQGNSQTATPKLDLRGGSGGNIVYRNFVGGTFSKDGGYWPSDGAVADEWMNNFNNGGFREGRPV